jgi:hypothetical protein
MWTISRKTEELLAAQETLFSTPFVNNDGGDDNDDNKKNNNEDLTAETHRIWNVKAKEIPAITGETGSTPKSFI